MNNIRKIIVFIFIILIIFAFDLLMKSSRKAKDFQPSIGQTNDQGEIIIPGIKPRDAKYWDKVK